MGIEGSSFAQPKSARMNADSPISVGGTVMVPEEVGVLWCGSCTSWTMCLIREKSMIEVG